MKTTTTTATKKEYHQPQMIQMGNAVKATLGVIGIFADNLFGVRFIP